MYEFLSLYEKYNAKKVTDLYLKLNDIQQRSNLVTLPHKIACRSLSFVRALKTASKPLISLF